MRWSSILKTGATAEDLQDVTVLSYTPKTFNFGTPEAALEYLREKELGSDFVMSDVLRVTTGVEEIERQTEEQKRYSTGRNQTGLRTIQITIPETGNSGIDKKFTRFDH